MKLTNEIMDKLQKSVESIALRDGSPITGYVTEQTTMYMEKGAPVTLAPNDTLLYQYSSGDSNEVSEILGTNINIEKAQLIPDLSVDLIAENARLVAEIAELKKPMQNEKIVEDVVDAKVIPEPNIGTITETTPTMVFTVTEIKRYMKRHDIEFEVADSKKVMLQKIEATKTDPA